MSVLPSVQPFHAIAYPLDPMLALDIRYDWEFIKLGRHDKKNRMLYSILFFLCSVYNVFSSHSLQSKICCTLLCNCFPFCSSTIQPSRSYSNQAGGRLRKTKGWVCYNYFSWTQNNVLSFPLLFYWYQFFSLLYGRIFWIVGMWVVTLVITPCHISWDLFLVCIIGRMLRYLLWFYSIFLTSKYPQFLY